MKARRAVGKRGQGEESSASAGYVVFIWPQEDGSIWPHACALGSVPGVTDWRQDRVGSALPGENPMVLARLPGAFAVMGDVQWLPGYCVLLTDRPDVAALNDLDLGERRKFLGSMAVLGEAVESACREVDPGFRRLNYDVLGNTDEFLHAHVWPRYEWESTDRVTKPVWLYPPEFWSLRSLRLGPQHDGLRAAITGRLLQLGGSAVEGGSAV